MPGRRWMEERVEADELIVGIDFGTTYSLVAALQGGSPVLLPNALGETLTPSAVSVADSGELLVGAPALARAATHPDRTALAFKRDMGTSERYQLADKSFAPQELAALVLAGLKADAEAALGHPVREAVVTVPAYFGDLQRQATREAGRLAGLVVERIVNEPTAASLAYGLHQLDRECQITVLDLGGGTFDVTVLEIIEGCIEVQASAGDSRLGGEDFVTALEEECLSWLKSEHRFEELDRSGRARLRQACEIAKKRLSAQPEATVVVPGLPLGRREVDVEIPITRERAEELWRPLLDRIRGPIVRALRDASLRPEQIEEVLLVGGATRMPCISALAAQLFGRLPARSLPPDEAVALGAAVQAGLKQGNEAVEDLVVTDVAPFTLGVEVAEKSAGRTIEGLFSPILERGTVIPASRVEQYHPLEPGQTKIELNIYQGEHARCERNHHIGRLTVSGIPRHPSEVRSVDVRFTYDLNGILEVETTIVKTGKKARLVIEQRPGTLSSGALEQALKRMQGLKLHPRDALPNTTALARAEALYTELTGPARQRLAGAMSAFRLAVEGQDPIEIAEMREMLVALTAALRG